MAMPLPNLEKAAPVSGDILHEFLSQFERKARKALRERGISVLQARVFDWQSTEDPTWKQKILVIKAACDAARALAAWDQLGALFLQAIKAKPLSIRDSLLEGVSFEVDWDRPNDL